MINYLLSFVFTYPENNSNTQSKAFKVQETNQFENK